MSNALLIVDVQHYFLQDAPADLAQRIKNHTQSVQYDHVLFAIFKNTHNSYFAKTLKWDKCSTPEDTQPPKEFADLITRDNVFTRASYSAFKTTNLHQYLHKRHVERLVICGVDSDACVLATAFEAFDLGYHVKIDFSLTYSSNDLHEASRLIAMKNILSRD